MKGKLNCFLRGAFGFLILCLSQSAADDWPRFRGPNGSGVSESVGLPLGFGPNENVIWKTTVPFARSSPIVADDRLFLTASEGDDLITMCFDSRDGRLLWERRIKRARAAEIYRQNDPASPTPVADQSNVYAFFPDLGLVSYGPGGKERWRVPLEPFNSFYGMANSPIIVDEAVVQLCDARTDPFLIAVDRNSGRILWKVKRPTLIEGFSTPIVRSSENGKSEILVFGNRRLDAYSPEDGEMLWNVTGFGYFVIGGTVLGDGETVFLSASGSDTPSLPPFDETLKIYDANGDGMLERKEVKANEEYYEHFGYTDTNADGFIDTSEYNFMRTASVGGQGFAAISLKGHGQMTECNILWRYPKTYPSTTTPILYQGILYGVKDGGIIVALDPATGKVLKDGRTKEAMEAYYSSPVAADGMIYTISEAGKTSVIRAGPDWKVLKVIDLGEECYATPAVASGRIYIRTRNTLFCFGEWFIDQPAIERVPAP
jgi:outer membrane protein assembly factor BamB